MSGTSLRPATAADVPRLTELVRVAYEHYVERVGRPPRPMTDDYAEVVRSSRVTVAEAGGEIVGLVVVGVDDEGFFIDNVAVDPRHQGIGIGKALAPGFAHTFVVVNGFSDLILELWGEPGRHARAAPGVAALPLNVPVVVEAPVELRE